MHSSHRQDGVAGLILSLQDEVDVGLSNSDSGTKKRMPGQRPKERVTQLIWLTKLLLYFGQEVKIFVSCHASLAGSKIFFLIVLRRVAFTTGAGSGGGI